MVSSLSELPPFPCSLITLSNAKNVLNDNGSVTDGSDICWHSGYVWHPVAQSDPFTICLLFNNTTLLLSQHIRQIVFIIKLLEGCSNLFFRLWVCPCEIFCKIKVYIYSYLAKGPTMITKLIRLLKPAAFLGDMHLCPSTEDPYNGIQQWG